MQYLLVSNLLRLCYVNGTHGITICKRDQNNRYARSMLLMGHRQYVASVLYHPTKPMLVSCGHEGIFVWDLEKGTCVQQIMYAQSNNFI